MVRPCGHIIEIQPGEPYKKGTCRVCWLYFNREDYKFKWDNEIGGQMANPSAKFRFTGKRNCNCKESNYLELLSKSSLDQS